MRDMRAALAEYRRILDFPEAEIVEVPAEGVRIASLRFGDVALELLEPLGDQGAIAKFLRERGEGIHHIALEVDNVAKVVRRAAEAGMRVVYDEPRQGAHGRRMSFVHPKSLRGVLLELCEYDRPAG